MALFIAMSRSVSSARWVLVGNPEGRRVSLFQEVLTERGRSPAVVVAWTDLLAGRVSLHETIRPGDRVRLDSPGRDFTVEQQLLTLGAEDAEAEGTAFLPRRDVAALTFDKGALLYPRQWYLGFHRALRTIVAPQLTFSPTHRLFNSPSEIALLFDKPRCQGHLDLAGVPIPPGLGVIPGWENLLARMRTAHTNRVFVKLAHGSSASGIIAYRMSGDGLRHQAMTTVETVRDASGKIKLYNTRRVRTLTDVHEIAELIDAIAPHCVAAEEWLPKASLPGKGTFDIRALAIGGRLRHVVGRCSQTPMTNLHLLNDRATEEVVRARVGEAAWNALTETVARAASAFPGSLHVGLDVLWTPDFKRLAVVEANAFGDLLPGTLSEGESTYDAEITTARTFRPKQPAESVWAW
jgi:hypothetical protein